MSLLNKGDIGINFTFSFLSHFFFDHILFIKGEKENDMSSIMSFSLISPQPNERVKCRISLRFFPLSYSPPKQTNVGIVMYHTIHCYL